ncbi:MAG: response regulator transcription factor [Oscillospiraceae bacterium]|nr:response regulator transcription factor [Oscillospiraceae bacterium]
MIKIALCDDEQKILEEVSQFIDKYAEKKNFQNLEIFRFDSVKALENALEDEKTFDIFILDVYIGDGIGTELAKFIRKKGIESPIVFLTTSLEHAPQSFETGTLRYLIKPVNPQKFYEAMDAAISQAEKLGERLIKFKTENGIESINASNIMYSEAHDHYQHITLDNGGQIKVRMTVAELFEKLIKREGFIRVGSAYIINLRNIRNVSTSEVHLYNDISIPIPRGKHIELKKAFWDFQCEGEGD